MSITFEKIIEEQFKFLVSEFQFKLEKCNRTQGGFDILYINVFCAVHIVYEFREAYLFITLHKLKNGAFVDNPRPIKSDSLITGYSLDDILSQRAPNAIIKPAYAYGENSEYYDKELGMALYVSQFAKNLKKYASDVLTGDFKIFKLLEPIIKKRAQDSI